MQVKLEDVLRTVEEQLGRSVVNLLVVRGLVMKKLPMAETRDGDPKFKFVLGFEHTKSMFVCARGDMAVELDDDLSEGDVVRVIGKLHTAHWEDDGEKRDTFECHSYSVEIIKPEKKIYS
jgi:hypothetical protein